MVRTPDSFNSLHLDFVEIDFTTDKLLPELRDMTIPFIVDMGPEPSSEIVEQHDLEEIREDVRRVLEISDPKTVERAGDSLNHYLPLGILVNNHRSSTQFQMHNNPPYYMAGYMKPSGDVTQRKTITVSRLPTALDITLFSLNSGDSFVFKNKHRMHFMVSIKLEGE